MLAKRQEAHSDGPSGTIAFILPIGLMSLSKIMRFEPLPAGVTNPDLQ